MYQADMYHSELMLWSRSEIKQQKRSKGKEEVQKMQNIESRFLLKSAVEEFELSLFL